jgi:NADPH-dependent 2,4-dienoyl-CoA reductase/sulfur reductase-like enzyme
VAQVEAVDCQHVVVVGGGYIGLEIAEAFLHRQAHVVLVEQAPQVMASLDPEIGALVTAAMHRHGVEVHLDTAVTGFEPGKVLTADGVFDADIVVLGIGVTPNSELADAAGIRLGVRRSIRVDRRQRTSAEGVWAAGDCCESRHLMSGEPVHVPLGTVANRQSRVAGTNIGGGYATFPPPSRAFAEEAGQVGVAGGARQIGGRLAGGRAGRRISPGVEQSAGGGRVAVAGGQVQGRRAGRVLRAGQ